MLDQAAFSTPLSTRDFSRLGLFARTYVCTRASESCLSAPCIGPTKSPSIWRLDSPSALPPSSSSSSPPSPLLDGRMPYSSSYSRRIRDGGLLFRELWNDERGLRYTYLPPHIIRYQADLDVLPHPVTTSSLGVESLVFVPCVPVLLCLRGGGNQGTRPLNRYGDRNNSASRWNRGLWKVCHRAIDWSPYFLPMSVNWVWLFDMSDGWSNIRFENETSEQTIVWERAESLE
jgi:hypothetical protein